MIRSITVENPFGELLKMELGNPWASGFNLVSIEGDGLGPTQADINTSELSASDGSVFTSARLSERNLVLNISFVGVDIESLRLLSYRMFPMKKYVTLYIETDNRFAEVSGYVKSNVPDIFSSNESIQVTIVCPSSFLYSSGDNEYIRTIFGGVDPVFEFPFSNESLTVKLLEFGSINKVVTETVAYDGDVEIGVYFYLNILGPVGNITLYNLTSGASMALDVSKITTLTGTALNTGDSIIISTVSGEKFVQLLRNGVVTNIMNALDKYTDWITLSQGDNQLAYSATSGQANIQVTVVNRQAYSGV